MTTTTSETSNITIRRRGYALGAEITGVDATKPLDDAARAAIGAALDEHLVVYLPRQDVNATQFREFCANFGELDIDNIGALNKIPGFTDVIVRANRPVTIDGVAFKKSSPANRWHSDYSYRERPSPFTFIVGKDMPKVGGDTMFANMYMAYETLSPAMRALIDPLEAVHDYPVGAASYPTLGPEEQARDRKRNPPWVQPVVRTHPVTGRKSLYVDAFCRNFVGMTDEESKPIIDFLMQHATRYEFVYRHRWNVNDLLMWNNRYLLHYVVQDNDPSELRRTFRASTVGPKSGYLLPIEGAHSN